MSVILKIYREIEIRNYNDVYHFYIQYYIQYKNLVTYQHEKNYITTSVQKCTPHSNIS